MNLKFFSIFLFFFLVSFVSSVTLSMSPPQIDFIGKTNEVICKYVEVKVEGVETLTGKTRWAEKDYFERNLLNHKLESEDLKIEIDFPNEIEVRESKKIEICIEGSKKGNYHGALLYRIEDKPVQVGIWMNVSLEGKDMVRITGNFVKDEEGSGNVGVYFAVILLLILGSLLVWSRRRNL